MKRFGIIFSGILTAALLVLALNCRSVFTKTNVLRMATKPMTEQYILGYMTKALIEQETNLTVEITEGVGGGTLNIQPAMESGKFDFYPEYTGTGWNAVLKNSRLYNESMFPELQTGYEKLNMIWIGMLGFNNTFGIAVTRETARQYNLKTYSDLAAVAGKLTFGAEYDFFERGDGYNALRDVYGLKFKKTMDLDIGLKYDAINQLKIDAMNIFTTDGQLSVSDIVVLKDDKNLYPSYMCGFVVRKETLQAHPELGKTLDRMSGLITDAEMANMNYQVESGGKNPEEVAVAYLRAKGLLN
ncbi:MAG: glycine betaine ABC transporter substrate-binding protein [Synergistaceae bacterium]|nr:glycine betaine ABC transporter substrate-binding protein [Synergistaceae bacterium]